ncbi:hypothetical protein SEUCBS139899_007177 [Sporothrix eucalyptigena]
MITDDQLYNLAVFLGMSAMVLIVVYHFLEVNATEESPETVKVGVQAQAAAGKASSNEASPSSKPQGALAIGYFALPPKQQQRPESYRMRLG